MLRVDRLVYSQTRTHRGRNRNLLEINAFRRGWLGLDQRSDQTIDVLFQSESGLCFQLIRVLAMSHIEFVPDTTNVFKILHVR